MELYKKMSDPEPVVIATILTTSTEHTPPTPQDAIATRERSKSKQHKLSSRMALLSKGGQKNNIPKPITIKESADGRGQRSSTNGINSPEMVTSDYDSCFETDPESGGSASDGTRRTDDDADSGVIESATGTVATGTDLGDLKEVVDLLDSEEDPAIAAQEEARVQALLDSLDEKIEMSSLSKEALELLKQIPTGYVPLPHQVGGHRHIEGRLGFLRQIGQPDILYKPVQSVKGNRELNFYENIYSCDDPSLTSDIRTLKQLIPKFFGHEEICDHYGDVSPYIMLEDIASRFNKPCIMDVKVGKRVYDDFAEQTKIDREMKKFPQQQIIGFRIIGMRVFRGDDYVYFNKEFGRSRTVDTTLPSVREFFFDGAGIRDDVICALIGRLQQYREWVESQKSFRMFATSILIVYEGDMSRSCDTVHDLLDVRLVDFAHVYNRDSSENGPDENFLFGLKSFVHHLHQLK